MIKNLIKLIVIKLKQRKVEKSIKKYVNKIAEISELSL